MHIFYAETFDKFAQNYLYDLMEAQLQYCTGQSSCMEQLEQE